MAIDDVDIRQLEAEADLAGDEEMVRHCRCALGGDVASRQAVARVIDGWRDERRFMDLADDGVAAEVARSIVREASGNVDAWERERAG